MPVPDSIKQEEKPEREKILAKHFFEKLKAIFVLTHKVE